MATLPFETNSSTLLVFGAIGGGILAVFLISLPFMFIVVKNHYFNQTSPATPTDAKEEEKETDKKKKKKDGDEDGSDDDEEGEKDEEEFDGYKKVKQIWNEKKVIWQDRRKLPAEVSEEDKEKFLFISKNRVYPNSDNEEGFNVIEIFSKPLIEVLKIHLKENDSIYDEKPTVDADDVFTFRKDIKNWVKETEEKVKEMEKEEEAKKKEEEEKEKEKSSEEKKETVAVEEKKEAVAVEEKKETVAVEEKKDEVNSEESKEVKIEEPDVEDLEEEEDPSASTKPKPPTLSVLSTQLSHTKTLLTYLSQEYASTESKLSRLEPRGEISFKLLWTTFIPGMLVTTMHPLTGEKMCFIVKRVKYGKSSTGSDIFCVSGNNIEWNGEKYIEMQQERNIVHFKGLRKLSSLIVYPIPEKTKTELAERSALYIKYAGNHFMFYEGPLIKRQGQKFVKLRADGRVMIDAKSFRKMCPDEDKWEGYSDDDDDEEELAITDFGDVGAPTPQSLGAALSDEQKLLLPPSVFGFSFSLKVWGEMKLDGFKPIQFDPLVYHSLVMDESQKKMIKALVESSRSEELITDVVAGKGGGIILCCHGPPGVGKTLTAEAIAELLERPLYAISSGELGTDAYSLENNLRDTLEVAQTWGAVLLIDEADVFLEARSDHEMGRNALVSVFLRTLEYFTGVMILTTNRVKTFDEAFLSRFSAAIKYPNLDRASRELIWRKFLTMTGAEVESETPKLITDGKSNSTTANGSTSGVQDSDSDSEISKGFEKVENKSFFTLKELKSFAARPLNGRQCKNIVRSAQAIAINDGQPFSAKYVEVVIKLNEQFKEDFESVDTENYHAKGEKWTHKNAGLYQ